MKFIVARANVFWGRIQDACIIAMQSRLLSDETHSTEPIAIVSSSLGDSSGSNIFSVSRHFLWCGFNFLRFIAALNMPFELHPTLGVVRGLFCATQLNFCLASKEHLRLVPIVGPAAQQQCL